ncbi:MAG: TIGR00730 family Rossman fold protein [Paludibacteraceae bacterium]|nr:TIGR00730 family Rossman fold protein [Paludibacteraceae bacterium]
MNVCVYCSAKDAIGEDYKALGRKMGRWIAEKGHTLVFGGATGGLMTEVSRTAYEAGAPVVGVVPGRILATGRRSPWCTETIEVEHMNARKQKMKELADCFVCLPGSYGTLDEMFDVVAAGTVGEHRKPLYVLNHNGFYAPLMEEIALMKQERFIPAEEHYTPHFADSEEELYSLLTSHYNKLERQRIAKEQREAAMLKKQNNP